MKLWRGVLTGIILWVVIFFEVSILMFGFGLQDGTTYYVIHYILLALFLIIASLVYFKKAKKGAVEGLLLGLIFVITGAVLDAVITVPLFVKDYSLFFNANMLPGYLESIILPIIVGALKR